MKSHTYKKNHFGIFSLTVVLIFSAAGIAFFSITEYSLHKRNYNEHLNEKLRVAAYMTNTLLTPEFHDRALDAQSIDAMEYTRNIERLSEMAKELDVIYIYTMVEREGKIYFTASNATDEERKTGINLTTYFEHYEEPSKELVKVFATHKSGYDAYSDKWGSFRSYFLPRVSPQGNFYVVAADIETTRIERELKSALLEVKSQGQNGYRFITAQMQQYSKRYLKLSHDLHRAIANDEFTLHYQPQIETLSGKLIGAEALLRWHHKELGDISPSEFIPIAEENGFVIEIGEWVLQEALKQIKEWNETYGADLVMAINLSAVQFRHPLFIGRLLEIVESIGVKRDFIELEITQSMAMHDTKQAIEIVRELHEEGIRIAIDDFGTGYCFSKPLSASEFEGFWKNWKSKHE